MNSSSATANGTILVADDDPVFRSLVVKRIQMLGAIAIETASGAEAWQVLTSRHVDLALIDIDMPGMTGVELIQCMRGYPRTRHLPAVVITSIARSEVVRQALGAGCTGYLTKPLQSVMFNGYIGHLLELSRKSRSAEEEIAEHRRVSASLIAECRSRALAALQRSGGPDAATVQAEIASAFGKLTHGLAALGTDAAEKGSHAA